MSTEPDLAEALRLESASSGASSLLDCAADEIESVRAERDAEAALSDRLADALSGVSEWLPAEATGTPIDMAAEAALTAYYARRSVPVEETP